jgi:hypothetical protein
MRQAACHLPFVEESQFNARKLAKAKPACSLSGNVTAKAGAAH